MNGIDLLIAIEDKEIKKGSKFVIKGNELDGVIALFDGEDIIATMFGKDLALGAKYLISSTFEVIEDEEIDIDGIEELWISDKDEKFFSPIIVDNRIAINELIKVVKQLNKKIKEKE